MGPRHQVVLPPSYLSWALALPDSTLSPEGAYVELNSIASVLGDDIHMTDTWPGGLIKTDLIKSLDFILPVTKEELEYAIDIHFGKSEKWTELPLDTLRTVVAQAASRYTVGLPLCELKVSNSCLTGLTVHRQRSRLSQRRPAHHRRHAPQRDFGRQRTNSPKATDGIYRLVRYPPPGFQAHGEI